MKKLTNAFTLIELLVVISIIAILAGIALPVFSQVQEKGQQAKDLSNAKQIGLACKLFAGDNDGKYPYNKKGTVTAITTANEAFRNLVPEYVPSEKIFYLTKSAWTPNPPDEDTTGANNAKALVAGENNYAYVSLLTDTSNPNFPLLADGFSSTVGVYSPTETAQGGVWKGRKAIVIRTDTSGNIEKVTAATYLVAGKTGTPASDLNIFSSSATWLSATQLPLNPE